jgi:hypothetical protein
MEESFNGVKSFYMHQQNRRYVHFLLARMTHHISEQCGIHTDFSEFLDYKLKHPYQVEHVWADKYDQHKDEFSHSSEFEDYRNKFGDLILLPDDFNQSYGKKPYVEKLEGYLGQNVLAKSFHPEWYKKNPSFLSYRDRSGLPFKPYAADFKKANIDERQELYRLLCEQIWSTKRFDESAEKVFSLPNFSLS